MRDKRSGQVEARREKGDKRQDTRQDVTHTRRDNEGEDRKETVATGDSRQSRREKTDDSSVNVEDRRAKRDETQDTRRKVTHETTKKKAEDREETKDTGDTREERRENCEAVTRQDKKKYPRVQCPPILMST